MRAAADTNLLVYAEGLNGQAVQKEAKELLRRLSESGRLLIPVQVLGELHRVLKRKAKLGAAAARRSIDFWSIAGSLGATSTDAFADAVELATLHGLDIWDSVILSVSDRSGCAALLSEDLQHGFVWRGCTVLNPLAAKPHPLLKILLN